MKDKHNIVVIVPVYYNKFSDLELCSLRQGIKILSKYPIVFVLPESLPIANDLALDNVTYKTVPDSCMDSIASYSRMLCSSDFYQMFSEYEYILIYQLDAFIFEDRLEYFCQLGFDYYGAPWLEGTVSKKKTYCVGNGGFSLRKIQSCLKVLSYRSYWGEVEDVFWAESDSRDFKVAPFDIALQFSFEMYVKSCYIMNGHRLPMGCHGWWKIDFCFWKPLLEQEGYVFHSVKEIYRERFAHWISWDLNEETLRKWNLFPTSEKKIYIWGTKVEGVQCGHLLNKIGHVNYAYIDSNSELCQRKLWGKPILSPTEFCRQKDDCIIIVATRAHDNEITEDLKGMGVEENNIYCYRNIIETIKKNLDGITDRY